MPDDALSMIEAESVVHELPGARPRPAATGLELDEAPPRSWTDFLKAHVAPASAYALPGGEGRGPGGEAETLVALAVCIYSPLMHGLVRAGGVLRVVGYFY